MAEGTGDSPQKRGAAKREAARKAALAGNSSSGTPAVVTSVMVGVTASAVPAGDSVRMVFSVEDEMLAVSRTLRSIGRVHTVDVSPYGFILTRTAD